MNLKKSVFKSKTIWGVLAMVAAPLATAALARAGIVDPGTQAEIINSAVTLGGAALAVYGRAKATHAIG